MCPRPQAPPLLPKRPCSLFLLRYRIVCNCAFYHIFLPIVSLRSSFLLYLLFCPVVHICVCDCGDWTWQSVCMFITARDLCGRSQQHFTLTPEDTEVGGAVTLWSREWQGVQAAGSSSQASPCPAPPLCTHLSALKFITCRVKDKRRPLPSLMIQAGPGWTRPQNK